MTQHHFHHYNMERNMFRHLRMAFVAALVTFTALATGFTCSGTKVCWLCYRAYGPRRAVCSATKPIPKPRETCEKNPSYGIECDQDNDCSIDPV